MPFKEGESGNPNGRPKSDKQFRDALTLAIKRTDGDKSKLDRVADALIDKALTGDVPAINAIADRLDGKANQAVEVTHAGEVTFKSAAISALNSFFAEEAGRGADKPHKDALPN